MGSAVAGRKSYVAEQSFMEHGRYWRAGPLHRLSPSWYKLPCVCVVGRRLFWLASSIPRRRRIKMRTREGTRIFRWRIFMTGARFQGERAVAGVGASKERHGNKTKRWRERSIVCACSAVVREEDTPLQVLGVSSLEIYPELHRPGFGILTVCQWPGSSLPCCC